MTMTTKVENKYSEQMKKKLYIRFALSFDFFVAVRQFMDGK